MQEVTNEHKKLQNSIKPLAMKNINIPIFVIFFVPMFLPLVSLAQPDGWGDWNGDTAAPIDGGISLLIAGGIGYGIKKLNERKKKTTAQEKE